MDPADGLLGSIEPLQSHEQEDYNKLKPVSVSTAGSFFGILTTTALILYNLDIYFLIHVYKFLLWRVIENSPSVIHKILSILSHNS